MAQFHYECTVCANLGRPYSRDNAVSDTHFQYGWAGATTSMTTGFIAGFDAARLLLHTAVVFLGTAGVFVRIPYFVVRSGSVPSV